MSNPNEGNAFMGDVSCNVHTLMCGYYKATKDYIHECHNMMRVLFFCMTLVIVYILCCASIAK